VETEEKLSRLGQDDYRTSIGSKLGLDGAGDADVFQLKGHGAMKGGTVYWITGLSGAGKTTIGTLFYQHIKAQKPNVIYLDGDILREVFGGSHGHAPEVRKKLAMQYSRLCKMLSEQGVDVVCATISMFHSVREWNRQNIKKYVEVYIKVPIDVLIERDQKQLYSRALKGEMEHVMGIDVPVEEPGNPDVVVVNDGNKTPEEIARVLIKSLGE
jgi:adenylylsulfate kinase-like enzyme